MKKINLYPFDSQFKKIKVRASIKKDQRRIHCTWELVGLALKAKRKLGARRDELWKGNVFEFFLKKIGEKKYYEIHLDELLNWNIYQLSHYRSELLESDEVFIEKADIFSVKENSVINLSLQFTEHNFSQNEWLFLCSVIWKTDNTFQYFSSSHPMDKPDFHMSKYYVKL